MMPDNSVVFHGEHIFEIFSNIGLDWSEWAKNRPTMSKLEAFEVVIVLLYKFRTHNDP